MIVEAAHTFRQGDLVRDLRVPGKEGRVTHVRVNGMVLVHWSWKTQCANKGVREEPADVLAPLE